MKEPSTDAEETDAMEHIVLLVDDDKNVIRGLARTLRRQPYELYTAESADEAMWVLKSHDVDVLVTDEKMPGMSGCELVGWVAEHYPEVVRILLTGYATTETAIRAINEGGVYRFFTKPCRDIHLGIAIRKALEQRERMKENLRLRELRQRGGLGSESLGQNLQILSELVADDLQRPLRAVFDLCCLQEQEASATFDTDAKALLDNALDAATEIQQTVASLLENHAAAEPPGAIASWVPDNECPPEPQ
jgi:two-component system probable response regulator PhcQ